jgi:hypothetical protein
VLEFGIEPKVCFGFHLHRKVARFVFVTSSTHLLQSLAIDIKLKRKVNHHVVCQRKLITFVSTIRSNQYPAIDRFLDSMVPRPRLSSVAPLQPHPAAFIKDLKQHGSSLKHSYVIAPHSSAPHSRNHFEKNSRTRSHYLRTIQKHSGYSSNGSTLISSSWTTNVDHFPYIQLSKHGSSVTKLALPPSLIVAWKSYLRLTLPSRDGRKR